MLQNGVISNLFHRTLIRGGGKLQEMMHVKVKVNSHNFNPQPNF